jgi:hypothetical protein
MFVLVSPESLQNKTILVPFNLRENSSQLEQRKNERIQLEILEILEGIFNGFS